MEHFISAHVHHHCPSDCVLITKMPFFITLVYSFTLQNKSGNLFVTADDGTGAVTMWQTGVITAHADASFRVDDEGNALNPHTIVYLCVCFSQQCYIFTAGP
jgi:hypothetical protein